MSNESNKKNNIGRMPIIPIDFDNIDNSVKGELVVDWEDRSIYGKNPYTNKVTQLAVPDEKENKSELAVSYFAGTRPLPHRYAYDDRSVSSIKQIVQLVGFDKCDVDDIPYKSGDGYLMWDNKYDVSKSSMNRNKIIGNKVNNDMLILKDGNFYEVKDLNGDIVIRLPINIETSYSKIVMKLSTNDNTSYSIYGNITWEYKDDSIFKPNTTRLYIFETWDSGANWFISTKMYNYDNHLNIDYFKDNYFDKSEVSNLVSWSYVDNPDAKYIYKIRGIKTLKEYKEIEKDNNTFYFIEDSSQIFRGNNSFSINYRLVDEFPSTDILDNIIYIKKINLEKRMYNGSDWIILSEGVTQYIDDTIEDDNTNIPNKAAILNYIKSRYLSTIDDTNKTDMIVTPNALKLYIENITLDKLDGDINKLINYNILIEYIKYITTSDILISDEEFDKIKDNLITANAVKTYADSLIPTGGFIDDISYDENGNLFVKGTDENRSKTIILENQVNKLSFDQKKNALMYSTGKIKDIEVPIPKINNIKNTSCDATSNILTITYDDNSTFDIDLSELFTSLNPTKFTNSNTTTVSIDNDNKTKVDVKVSNKENNILKTITEDSITGLYIEKQMPLLTDSVDNKIVLSKQDGESKCSIYSISDNTNSDHNTTVLVTKAIIELIERSTAISNKNTNIIKWSNKEGEEGLLAEVNFSSIQSMISISEKENNILSKVMDGDDSPNNGLYATLTENDLDKFKIAKRLENSIGEKLLLSIKDNGNYKESNITINTDSIGYGADTEISTDNIHKEYIDSSISSISNYREEITKENISDFSESIISFDNYIDSITMSTHSEYNVYINEIITSPYDINITTDNNVVINGTWKCKGYINGELIDQEIGVSVAQPLVKYIFIAEFQSPDGYVFNPLICNKVTSFISSNGKTYSYKFKKYSQVRG